MTVHKSVHKQVKEQSERLATLENDNKAKKMEISMIQQEISLIQAQIMKTKRQQDMIYNDSVQIQQQMSINQQRYNQARSMLVQEIAALQAADQQFLDLRNQTEECNDNIIEQRQIVESLAKQKNVVASEIKQLTQDKQYLAVEDRRIQNQELKLRTQGDKMEYQHMVVKSKL